MVQISVKRRHTESWYQKLCGILSRARVSHWYFVRNERKDKIHKKIEISLQDINSTFEKKVQ